MALPSSGAIAASEINVELGRSSTTLISLDESVVRALFGKPSGQISFSDGYGKSNLPNAFYRTGVTNPPTGGGNPQGGTLFGCIGMYNFDNCTVNDLSAKLATPRPGSGHLSARTKGYFVGGSRFVASMSTQEYTEIDGIDFATLTSINPAVSLNQAMSISGVANGPNKSITWNGNAGFGSPTFRVTKHILVHDNETYYTASHPSITDTGPGFNIAGSPLTVWMNHKQGNRAYSEAAGPLPANPDWIRAGWLNFATDTFAGLSKFCGAPFSSSGVTDHSTAAWFNGYTGPTTGTGFPPPTTPTRCFAWRSKLCYATDTRTSLPAAPANNFNIRAISFPSVACTLSTTGAVNAWSFTYNTETWSTAPGFPDMAVSIPWPGTSGNLNFAVAASCSGSAAALHQ